MGWGILLRNRERESEAIDVAHEQTKAAIVQDENQATNVETQAAGGIAFDFQVIDDEKILGLFDPANPLFHPLVLPLLPLVSRMMYLTSCTEHEARTYCLQVNIQIARLKNRAESVEDFMLLDSLRGYMHMRINDSILGFKLVKLTERTSNKNINLRDEQQKKGLLG